MIYLDLEAINLIIKNYSDLIVVINLEVLKKVFIKINKKINCRVQDNIKPKVHWRESTKELSLTPAKENLNFVLNAHKLQLLIRTIKMEHIMEK